MVHLFALGQTISRGPWTNIQIGNLGKAFANVPSGDFVLLFICAHGTEGEESLLFGSDERVNPSQITLAVQEARHRGVRCACVLLSCFGARNPILTEGLEYIIAPARECRMCNILQDMLLIEEQFKDTSDDFFEHFQVEFFEKFKNSHNKVSDCWGEDPEGWALTTNEGLTQEGMFFQKWAQVVEHFGHRFSEVQLHAFLNRNGYSYHRLKTMFANAREFVEFVGNLLAFSDRYSEAATSLSTLRNTMGFHLSIFGVMAKITRTWETGVFESLKNKSVDDIVEHFLSMDAGEHFQRTLSVA